MNDMTHEQFRRFSNEARRKTVPWVMLLLAAGLIGTAVTLALLAFGI